MKESEGSLVSSSGSTSSGVTTSGAASTLRNRRTVGRRGEVEGGTLVRERGVHLEEEWVRRGAEDEGVCPLTGDLTRLGECARAWCGGEGRGRLKRRNEVGSADRSRAE